MQPMAAQLFQIPPHFLFHQPLLLLHYQMELWMELIMKQEIHLLFWFYMLRIKSRIMVVGDFNNWTQAANYQMNMTPDSLRFWLRITGLTPGVEYAYQYIIDGSLTVADYNTEKILDKANDPYIPSATYPNLKPFPANATGNIVSVLQTAKPAYNWQVTNFSRPDKRNLIIYELLARDFVATHNYQTLIDTLSYLKRLGVNTIELMPISEFEGNDSWGYNPIFILLLINIMEQKQPYVNSLMLAIYKEWL